jgi:hypothetical protein
MEKNIQEEIQNALNSGWELVNVKTDDENQSETVKAFKKTVIVSLEDAMRINEGPIYKEDCIRVLDTSSNNYSDIN